MKCLEKPWHVAVEAGGCLVPAGTRSADTVGRARGLMETVGSWISGNRCREKEKTSPGQAGFLLPGVFNPCFQGRQHSPNKILSEKR